MAGFVVVPASLPDKEQWVRRLGDGRHPPVPVSRPVTGFDGGPVTSLRRVSVAIAGQAGPLVTRSRIGHDVVVTQSPPTQDVETQLLRQVNSGDEAAFGALVGPYRHELHLFNLARALSRRLAGPLHVDGWAVVGSCCLI